MLRRQRALNEYDHSKDEFLTLISHEFRTPLNGLLGTAEFMMEERYAGEEHAKLRGIFERSRERILALLDDGLLLTQLDVTRKHGSDATAPLGVALSRAVQLTTKFAGSRRVVLGPPPADTHVVMADGELLVRALQALLETAIKFSEEGGTVRIAFDEGLDALIIEGDGRMIPTGALGRFFDLFAISEASTPAGDLGLAPAVAHRILALFGASVTVANRDPAGIRLTVSLEHAEANRDASTID